MADHPLTVRTDSSAGAPATQDADDGLFRTELPGDRARPFQRQTLIEAADTYRALAKQARRDGVDDQLFRLQTADGIALARGLWPDLSASAPDDEAFQLAVILHSSHLILEELSETTALRRDHIAPPVPLPTTGIVPEPEQEAPPSPNAVESVFWDVARNFHKTDEVLLDFNWIFPGHPFTLQPGEVLMLISITGIGKSSLASNLVYHLGPAGYRPEDCTTGIVKVLDCQFEMTGKQSIGRYLQIAHNLRVSTVEGRNDVSEAFRQLHAGTSEAATLLAPLSHLSLHTIEMGPLQPHEIAMKAVTEGARVIVIDPLEAIAPPRGISARASETDKFEAIVNEVKQLAADYNVAVICIHHVNKQGEEADEIEIYHAKGLTRAIQQADFVVAMQGRRFTSHRRLVLKKSRSRDQVLDIPLVGDPATYRFMLGR